MNKWAAVGSMAAAVVFYTISGVIVASTKQYADQKSSTKSEDATVELPAHLSEIQLSAAVLPSQVFEGNYNPMATTNSTSPLSEWYGSAEDLLPERFEVTRFDKYFPQLHFMQDYIPEGSSRPFCLHIDWIEKPKSALTDRYIPIANMPYCAGAVSPKQNWDTNYPKTGLDFVLFK